MKHASEMHQTLCEMAEALADGQPHDYELVHDVLLELIVILASKESHNATPTQHKTATPAENDHETDS